MNVEAARADERNVTQLQCDTDEHALAETIDAMSAIYMDEDKDNAILVQSYLDQVDGFCQDIEKNWTVLKSLYKDAELTEFFTKQETLKKTLSDVTTKGVCLVRKYHPESVTPRKTSTSELDTASERSINTDRIDTHLKTESGQSPLQW